MTLTDRLSEMVISGDLLSELPDLGPCELVQGRIVMMTPTGPRHAKIEQQITWLLRSFLEEKPLGELYVGEVGIYTERSPDTVRGADVAFVSHQRLARHDPEAPYLTVAPELVIEILSPNDRAQEIEAKIREYIRAGTEEVWILDPEHRTVRRHRSDPSDIGVFGETDTLATPVLPGLELEVARIFEK